MAIPPLIVADPAVDHLSFRVWCLLTARSDNGDTVAYAALAADLGTVESSIRRCIAKLVRTGWAERTVKNGRPTVTLIYGPPRAAIERASATQVER